MEQLAAVVLAGGRARRFGADKLEARVGPGRLLERALDAAHDAGADPVVAVGPPRAGLPTHVSVVREDPPGGGPVAGLAAGLTAVGEAPVVLVLAGDLLDPAPAMPHLVVALTGEPGADAAVVVDAEGRRQPLLAAYRTAALRGALAAAPLEGRSMRDLLSGLDVVEVRDGGGWSRDVDRPEDLRPQA
jgi:molybdopterin-guanine dinucleotide biosynthesis protein A